MFTATQACHLQIHSTDLLLKIQAITFIRRLQPKPSFLQTKGHVCGRADISTSLSNSLTPKAKIMSRYTQRLCQWQRCMMWTCTTSGRSWRGCFLLSFKCSGCQHTHRDKHIHTHKHTDTRIMLNIYLLYWHKYIKRINKAQLCHICEKGTFP